MVEADRDIAVVDYQRLLDPDSMGASLAGADIEVDYPYLEGFGIRYRMTTADVRGEIEVVRLAEDAVIMFSDVSGGGEIAQRHVVSDGDWIHMQFRLTGLSTDEFTEDDLATGSEQTCLIVRHPDQSAITRITSAGATSRVACLFMKPQAIVRLFGIREQHLSSDLHWILDKKCEGIRWHHVDLPLESVAAISELFRCGYFGHPRFLYATAKASEMTSALLDQLQGGRAGKCSTPSLSMRDKERIRQAKAIMTNDLGKQYDLAQLARQVGLNRTKLSVGFKAIFGDSLQSYLRDVRLLRARELLEQEGLTVSEVSHLVGYSEPSCLTRAFRSKFGVQPKVLRAIGRTQHN